MLDFEKKITAFHFNETQSYYNPATFVTFECEIFLTKD